MSYIRGIKQEQEATKELAEQKTQNEKLVEMIGAMLNESQGTLFQILPELVEKVVLGALEDKVVVGDDLATALQTVAGTCVANVTSTAEGIKTTASINAVTTAADVTDKTGALPEVSEKLPDDALDYFSEL